ncbi:hypothetical protein BH10BAC3_BH10BAC3_10480 [soil metagenome]
MKHTVKKLWYKNFGIVLLNSINDAGATFEHNTNKVTILKKDKQMHSYPVKLKNGSC